VLPKVKLRDDWCRQERFSRNDADFAPDVWL